MIFKQMNIEFARRQLTHMGRTGHVQSSTTGELKLTEIAFAEIHQHSVPILKE
jgi:hypothetical protein